MSIAYHRSELGIARDPSNPLRSLPPWQPRHKRILDIGCGIGQTLMALNLPSDVEAYGIDADEEAIAEGKKLVPQNIHLIHGSGERLPFDPLSFDLVYSRVSMPYMDLSKVMGEVSRVLRKEGDFWATFHSFTMAKRTWLKSFAKGNVKEIIFNSYVMVNGSVLHLTGHQFPFPLLRKQESFQTETAVRRLARNAGLTISSLQQSPLTILATKP